VLDIIRPDTGEILWRGAPIDEHVRRRCGYLPEERGLYQKMRVEDQLQFFAQLYGMGRTQASEAIRRWLEVFGIADRRRSRIEELSKGNQQKVQVLTSLIHEPDLALLDEPFTGLDPLNVELLMDALDALKAKGKTVVFSSHQMGQVEDICEEVAIIARGRMALAGNLREIRDRATRRVIQVRTTSGSVPSGGLPLRPLEAAREYQRFALEDGADAQQVLHAIADRESVEYFSLERPSLQEIFIEVTAAGAEEGDPAPTAQPPAGATSPGGPVALPAESERGPAEDRT